MTMSAQVNVSRIDPTDWYVGMKDPSLQLMVYGKDIRSANVSTDYPGVSIDSLVRLDSPNYLLVYLNLKGAKPGTMKLTLHQQRQEENRRLRAQAACHGRCRP